ncbi:MAG: hemolysin family protein [Deltaproteobacteria bacterium]|nr:hemolysin family protein [Deltaproteobacteria bacterium]
MVQDSERSLWSRLAALFTRHDDESLEKAILEARAEGEVAADEGSMLLRILRLDEMQVSDIMTPRTDCRCVPAGTPLPEATRLVIASGHSRIPVYRETRDNIVGVVYAKDLLHTLVAPKADQILIEHIMHPPFFVPETKMVLELLQEFRSRKQHLAVALDEYGGTSGLVTIEDVLEEIVGDIEDEHDAPQEEYIKVLDAKHFELSGRADLEDLAELGIALASDEVDTIGGYLSLTAGHVPLTGEEFVLNGWKFKVLEAGAKAIHRIGVEPADDRSA